MLTRYAIQEPSRAEKKNKDTFYLLATMAHTKQSQ